MFRVMAAVARGLATMIDTHFPAMEFAFAYGSGVFKQAGYSSISKEEHGNETRGGPMIDMIFAVEDPLQWHAQNIEMNADHYALLPRKLGPKVIVNVQQSAASLYYNTLVPFPPSISLFQGQLMKYGVVSTADLTDDLRDWKTLYSSGRLQKPVSFLKWSPALEKPLQTNLRSALSAALLLLPSNFSEQMLFLQITSLSYQGDMRMGIAENPKKVENIVNFGDSMTRFRQLYQAHIDSFVEDGILVRNTNGISYSGTDPEYSLECDASTTAKLVACLPIPVQHDMVKVVAHGVRPGSTFSELLERGLDPSLSGLAFSHVLKSIVSHYSQRQTLKGIFTAGGSKRIVYSFQKIAKRLL